jgi:hypothetical protein
MHLKTFAAVAALSLATFGASATTTDLGSVSAGTPMAFGGYAPVGAFNDIFTFSLPANSGSGYSVSNFLSLPAQFNTVLSTLALVSNPDGILFNGDDALVSSSVFPGGDSISLAVGSQPAGDYYLNVTGLANGSQGGVYNGAISVSAVPEPETYAMMLAGLAVMGFMAGRRGSRR